MEDPDAATPESRKQGLYDLVRPYVGSRLSGALNIEVTS